jgi:predicted DNA-binding protein with PD1-like motif
LSQKAKQKDPWEREATNPEEYHSVEARRGREFIVRMTTGADVYRALQKFAKDKGIRFGKIHAAFMGGFSPARMFMWCPDPRDPCDWHNESAATFSNLSMLISMSGMIHMRLVDGKPEPFPAIHYCVGGAWDIPTVGGHLAEGTRVKGVVEVFVTEILGIEELLPSNYDPSTDGAPEEWYRETK